MDTEKIVEEGWKDPHNYHAKPKDLSVDALPKPKDHKLIKSGSHIFSSTSFSSLNLNEKLIEAIKSITSNNGKSLEDATKVQSVVIQKLLQSKSNILIKSQTGSGKTLAFLIPIINDLVTMTPQITRNEGTRAVIIAPTRELCSQIASVLSALTQHCVWVVGGSITGGEKRKSEKARLRKGIVVLVATPGRLLDHLRTTESFTLSSLRWLVLDEVDRLMDMGFEQTVLEIISRIRGQNLPNLKTPVEGLADFTASTSSSTNLKFNLQKKWDHQKALFAKKCENLDELVLLMASATITKAVQQLILPLITKNTNTKNKEIKEKVEGFWLVDADTTTIKQIKSEKDLKPGGPEKINLEVDFNTTGRINSVSLEKGETVEAPKQLSQYFMQVTCKWRLAALLSFLKTHNHEKVVVFMSTCDSVDFHSLLLREMTWPEDLDPPIEWDNDEETDKKSKNQQFQELHQYDTLEPLESGFTGLLGSDCRVYRLHGNVPQQARKTVFQEFCGKQRGGSVLLCTDVAARGLDLPRVDWIVQYDPPCETTDYVHRIGRTARSGLIGSALLFLLPSEMPYINLLSSHGLLPAPLSLQSLIQETAESFIPGAEKFKNQDEMGAVILQRRAENIVLGNKWMAAGARQAFHSFVRAYATHSGETKGIFRIKLLHIGHVAKSFALRDKPSNARVSEDILGKIFNGFYSEANISKQIKSKAELKAERDEKYKVSRSLGKRKGSIDDRDVKRGKTGNRELDIANKSLGFNNHNEFIKKGNDRQKLRKMGKSGTLKLKPSNDTGLSTNELRNKSSGRLTASGKFRKTSGYFRKKLRAQGVSEFSND